MGDAFRGLTIRIGADARPLQSAISSISKSASAATKQFNAMNKALRFDASNITAMRARLDLAGDKANLTAKAIREIKIAMSQAVAETKSFDLKRVAESTTDVYSKTEQLRSEYNHINAELAHIYEGAAKIKAAQDGMSFEKALKHVKKLASEMDESSAKARELHRLIQIAGATKATGLAERFGLGGMNNLVAGAKLATDVLSRLRSEHNRLQMSIEDMNRVEGYRAMKAQLVAYESELRQASAEAARFKSELYALGEGGRLMGNVQQLKRIDDGLEQATASARAMSQAFNALPKDGAAALAKIAAIKSETDSLNDKVKNLNATMRALEGAKGFNREANLAKNVYAEFAKAESAVADYDYKLKQAKRDHQALVNEAKELVRTKPTNYVATLNELVGKIDQAKEKVEEYRAALLRADKTLESAAIDKKWREVYEAEVMARAELERINAQSSKLNVWGERLRSLRTMGYGLYSTLTPAIMIAGRYAIQAADDIDAAYRDMRKTVNGTEEEFEHLKDAALDFSTTHVTSADTILEIEAMGGQLGIQAKNLEAFSEVVSNLTVATDIGAEDMAKYIGQLSNIMRDISKYKDEPEIYQKKITSFSDALVRLGNNSAAQESSIMKVMMRIASLGTISGFTTPQLLAISTAVAATGQGCEAAGTAISKTFSNIETAVGKGGESLEAFARVAGMSAQEFADSWEGDPITAFKAFIGGLKEIDESGGSVDNTLRELGITSVRQKQALEGLVNTYDVLNESLGMSQSAWDGLDYAMNDGTIEKAGDAAREAQRKAEGFSGALEIMKNNAKMLASELADGAAPIISGLGELFKNFAAAMKSMPDGMKTAIVGLLGLAAAAGPVTVAIGAVGSAFVTFMEITDKLAAGKTMAKAIEAFGGANVSALTKLEETFPRLANSVLNAQSALIGLGRAALPLAPPIAAAAAALAYLGTQIADSAAKHQAHIDNLEQLNTLMEETAPSSDKAVGGLTRLGEAAKKTAYDFDSVVEANAKMVSSIKERNESAQEEISSLQAAAIAIAKYGNANRKLNASEQGELVAAIDLINEKCNTQYQVLDKLTGKLGDESGAYLSNKNAILEYISQKQRLIEVEALEADMAELQARKRETLAAMVSTDDDAERVKLYQEYQGIASAIEWTTKAIAEYTAASQTGTATAGQMVRATSEWLAVFEGMYNRMGEDSPWKSYQESLGMFGEALDSAGIKIDQLSNISIEDLSAMANAWYTSGGDINAALAAIGLSAVSLEEQFRASLSGIGANFDELAGSLNMSADGLAAALQNAGIQAQDFASFTSEEIATALEQSGGTVDGFIAKLQEIGQQKAEVSVETEGTEEAKGEIDETAAAAEELDGESATVEVEQEGAEETQDEINETGDELDDLDGSSATVTVGINDYASSTINSIRENLRALDGSSATVTTYSKQEQRATGALYTDLIRSIPRHASGALNGIVARPTLTNIGWVGEAGAEAILHMRNAGGAVIPLSNRQYVRPFARAVAAEMGGGSTVNNISVTLDWRAGMDANDMVNELADALNRRNLMEA